MSSLLDLIRVLADSPLEEITDGNLYCLLRHARHYLEHVQQEEQEQQKKQEQQNP